MNPGLAPLSKALKKTQPDAEIREGYQTVNKHIWFGLAQERHIRITFTFNARTKRISVVRNFRTEQRAQEDLDRRIANMRKSK